MRRLFTLFLVSLCTSIGAWAEAVTIGSTSSTYESVTTSKNSKKMVTINLAASGDLTTAGWLDEYGNFTDATDATFKTVLGEADCVVIKGPLSADDFKVIGKLKSGISLLDLSGATVVSSMEDLMTKMPNPTNGLVLPSSISFSDVAALNNPYQLKTVFKKNGTEMDALVVNDGGMLTALKDDKYDFNTFETAGITTLNVYGLNTSTSPYTVGGATVTTDIINGINNAPYSVTAVNMRNAKASNLSMSIMNTHLKSIDLSGLTLSGNDVSLNIGGEAKSTMAIETVKLTNVTVNSVDATNLSTMITLDVEGANVSSIDITGCDYSKVTILTDDASIASKITPAASEGVNYTISEPVNPSLNYADCTMKLHLPETGDKFVYWYRVLNEDPVSTIADGEVTIKMMGDNVGKLSDILSEISEKAPFKRVRITGHPSAEDIAALGAVNADILDLSAADLSAADLSTMTSNNTNVKFIVMPPNSTRDQAQNGVNENTFTKFTALYSAVESHVADSKRSITAYVKQAGGLQAGVVAACPNVDNVFNRDNKQWYTSNLNTGGVTMHDVTLSGNLNAQDICNQAHDTEYPFNSEGHFEWDKKNPTEHALDNNDNTRDDRVIQGTYTPGALMGGTLVWLDLEKAVFAENYDMTLAYCGLLGSETNKVILPTSELVTDVPPYCFNGAYAINEICIPYNIQYIRAKAFAFTNAGLHHVWTTPNPKDANAGGENDDTVYDNGVIWNADGTDIRYGYTGIPATASSTGYPAGTYTFSSNLKCIESNAFGSAGPNVKDVYCLALEAPECHVDAFSTKMYDANNGFNPVIVDGIITRASYINNGVWITILHYPREARTPNTQRYTDQTRDYSIATAEKDGRGGTIYYPNLGEFVRAYTQGTYGFLWNAWDPERDGNMAFTHANALHGAYGWRNVDQTTANRQYNSNTSTVDKTTSVFYETMWPGVTTAIDATAKPYYENTWKEWYESEYHQLYPQPVVTKGADIDGETMQDVDEHGNLLYNEDPAGDFVKMFSYVKDANGTYKKTETFSGDYSSTDKAVDGVTEYFSKNGETYTSAVPQLSGTYYVLDGEKTVYSDAVYNPQTYKGELVETYYVNNGGTYTESPLKFNGAPKYYNPQSTEVPVFAWSYGQFYNEIDQWYDSNGDKVSIDYTFQTYEDYYKKVGDEYVSVSGQKYETGVTYYYKDNGEYKYLGYKPDGTLPGNKQYYWNQNYQYSKGVETKSVCQNQTDVWIPSVETYYDDVNATSVVNLQGSGIFSGTYYYKIGTEPNYVSASSTYDASKTYYSDQNGTVAEDVNFNGTYYVKDYEVVYTAIAEGEEVDEKYRKVYSETAYRAYDAETDAGETRYAPKMVQAKELTTKANDYRGWHQFVLVATATNSDANFTPIRSYITDNNWWTICLPYDLKKSEIHLLYGGGDETKTPLKVCRLMSVTRDVDNERITLNFSKNLMDYKWDKANNKVLDAHAEADPVVIEKGVPYLIRPNLKVDDKGTIEGKRRFDVYESPTSAEGDIETGIIQNKDLYDKLKVAAALTGSQMNQIIYDGEYTVPALVVNDTQNKENATESVTVNGTTYKKHPTLTYTFVGSFYKSPLPQYCYFLGWNKKQQQAAFYYNIVDPENAKTWAWINETAVILPGFDTLTEISEASSLEDPARWKISALTDDGYEATVHAKATAMVMDFGNIEADVTGIEELKSANTDVMQGRIYSVNGQYVGTDASRLTPGLYIRNGRKFVVK